MTIDQLTYDEILFQNAHCIIVRRNGVTEQYVIVDRQVIIDEFMNRACATLGL